LEAVSEIAEKGVVQVLEHTSLAYDIPYAFGPHHCYTKDVSFEANKETIGGEEGEVDRVTFIFPYVLQSKCTTSIFTFNDANFTKVSLSDNAKEPKVV